MSNSPATREVTSDRAAVVAATLDYFNGWFDGDSQKMDRVLHPALAKRSLRQVDADSDGLRTVTKEQMVAWTAEGEGKRADPAAIVRSMSMSSTSTGTSRAWSSDHPSTASTCTSYEATTDGESPTRCGTSREISGASQPRRAGRGRSSAGEREPRSGMDVDRDFFVDLHDRPSGPARAHEVRLQGGDRTTEIFQ